VGLIRPEGTRVLNYTWRGLGESSVFVNGTSGDCAIFFTGCVAVEWPATSQGAVYYTPNLVGSTAPGPYTWFGSLAANGAGSSGLLYRRNRYFDPVSGRFTQQDPIGVAGGMNLYGFGDGDPINFSDPFGLSACCPSLAFPHSGIYTAAQNVAGQQVVQLGIPEWISGPGGRGMVKAVRGLVDAGRRGSTIVRHAQNLRGLLQHVTPMDLRGAAAELRGAASGGQHLQEVREAVGGLREFIKDMNQAMSNPALSTLERSVYGRLVGTASKALDNAEAALRQR
jgi:RHS repeat-associated protein